MKLKKRFPVYKQLDAMDCGPTCLRMIAKYYGRPISAEYLRSRSQLGKAGVSLLGLAEAAESIGLSTIGVKLSFDQLVQDAPLPAILYWNRYHFVVLTPQVSKNRFVIVDPDKGPLKLSKAELLKQWISTVESGTEKGIALLLEEVPNFKFVSTNGQEIKVDKKKKNWHFLTGHIKQNSSKFFFVLLCLFLGSMLQLIFPYLTQNIVDNGIQRKNLNYIQLILAAQLMLLFSQTIIDFIRNRILLYLSTKINFSILSQFWSKLLRLPFSFFNTKYVGDIIQRIGDHHRIENFLTGTAITTIFSLFTLMLFSVVLFNYNSTIFSIFMGGSILYLLWIRLFLRLRRKLDYERFEVASKETNATMQMINGIQEIKLNNAEHSFRWNWEVLQSSFFKLNFKSLSLNQYQQIGAFFINQAKNIAIIFFSSKLVLEDKLTLGMMLSAQYIIGQLNSPIEQLVSFVQQAQDAKLSLERLHDIHSLKDEESSDTQYLHQIPKDHNISIKNLTFSYPGAGNEPVLKNITLTVPEKKITAIVGMSGSGKTTLLKLLLRFYDADEGEISLGDCDFKLISPKFWRSACGAVMQDSYIFNDTIQKNIVVTHEDIDIQRLLHACKTACLDSFIEQLPLGFNTVVGQHGNSISGGQQQRIAIARAVYKEPQFLFFDEATNSLDANNEKMILKNLQQFFSGKTVIIVAHRLSTVKNANKIIVLDEGKLVEEGCHDDLIKEKGKYYQLVKNQLELDG